MIGEVGSFPDSLVIPLKTNMEPKKNDGWVSRDLRDLQGFRDSGEPAVSFRGWKFPPLASQQVLTGTCRDLRLLHSHQAVKAAVPVNIAGMARAMVGFNFDMAAK